MRKSNIYSLLGAPFTFSVFGAYSGLSNRTPWQFLGCAAAALITLPLMPFAMLGSQMEQEEAQAEFQKDTSHLPHIVLPEESCWLDIAEDGVTFIGPQYDEYTDEASARAWLQANGYQEVVASNHANSTSTWFVKQENING